MRRIRETVNVILFLVVLSAVGSLHFGCEEEPTGPPSSCGTGPFVWDQKNGVCRNQETNLIVGSECCNY